MKKHTAPTVIAVEEWTIPTYPIPEAEEMPMFAETAVHQGTTGDPYPMRVVSRADGEHREDKKWTVVRLENDYIRLAVIPALGGRIFEAYDKVTGYDFLYRQHVIKPALIGAYGSWMSGGIEFNWPFHHRPSTVMPVDFKTEQCADGTAIVWLSEHAPCDRTKGMVGVVLRPDASYFETRVAVTNRTPTRQNFLWWENAAVAVHEEYRLVFPPDVTYVHHHNDAGHTTYPIAAGQYGADNIKEPKDISWHKNSRLATSYFAAPSKYDFFGGFDYRKNCGVLHIANHHVSPGKKLFTWGYGTNADNWEKKLTDEDGQYAELMAGSYTDDQPDFTWLSPYETKTFSQFWYPTQGIGLSSFASLDAALALDREGSEIRLNVTAAHKKLTLTVRDAGGKILLREAGFPMTPSAVVTFPFSFPTGEKLTVTLQDGKKTLLFYREEEPDYIHIPKDNHGTPLPDKLKTPMELVTAGLHVDQYRNPLYKPDIYYLEALRREPDFLPALKALGEFYCRTLRTEDALSYLDRAWKIECRYDQNPEDGRVGYLRGLCLSRLGRDDEAYDALYRAAWSNNVIAAAMTQLAAIDGRRGDYAAMATHALAALEKESRHPIAAPYAALAYLRRGEEEKAKDLIALALSHDCLNHLARYVACLLQEESLENFYAALSSDPAQTCLDLAFDLLDAGMYAEADGLLAALPHPTQMTLYTRAYIATRLGRKKKEIAALRKEGGQNMIVDVFPSRAGEMAVLQSALSQNSADAFAAYMLGCMMYHAARYEEAEELFHTACTSLHYIPWRNLALLYFNHLGDKEKALSLMQTAVDLRGDKDATLLGEYATMLQKCGEKNMGKALSKHIYRPGVTFDLLYDIAYGQKKTAKEEAEEQAQENAAFFASLAEEESDQLILALSRAFNADGRYEDAERAMRAHAFSPGEGQEFAVAEPYMYAAFARGRIALHKGQAEEALAFFRAAQDLPENLHVGFWNNSVMMPYRYYEAKALKELGRAEEAAAIIEELSAMRDVGMWNMGGEFVYYSAMSVRLGGDEMRAQKIMRDAILRWEAELSEGCTYHREPGSLYNCVVGDGRENRLAALYAMLGYGHLYNGKTEEAKEFFQRSLSLNPTAKIALEASLL